MKGKSSELPEVRRFEDKLRQVLAEQQRTLGEMEQEIGVYRSTIYRGVREKSTIAAIAYFLKMDAEELVSETEAMDIWYQ